MTFNHKILSAAAFLATTITATAQTKDPVLQDLNRVETQMKKAANNPIALARLQSRYLALHAQLYGAPVQPQSMPNLIVGPNYVQPGLCGGSTTGTAGTTMSFSSTPALAILDNSLTSDIIAVSGLGTQTFDVDLTVAITHTYGADLDISLVSPLGTVVDVCSDNGAFYDDVFNGTLFDDQSLNDPVTYAYVDFVAAPDLLPEQSMNLTFAGENPNGNWTLNVFDDAGGDIGVLNSWSLSITDGTIVVVPDGLGAPQTFSTGPIAAPIIDLTTTTVPLAVAGGPTNVQDVDCFIEITHTWNADLVITLESPALTQVVLSDRRGGANVDVFNGTLFDQQSSNEIASYAFTTGVVAPDLRPDGNLGDFAGENTNGTWNLIVSDNANADTGSINRFDLILRECSGSLVYCTAGVSTNGCSATMSSSTGTASIAAGAGSFIVTASNVEGQKLGLVFYGISGQSSAAWGVSSSFLCVKAPTQRLPSTNTNGTAGLCDGSLSMDFFGYMNANPFTLGQPISAGQVYNAQAWYRDPPSPKTTHLSNGIEFVLAP